jgi:hypothetical protein
MPDRHVTITTFADPTEAELAKEYLEAEGVPVLLSGDLSVAVVAGFGDMVGGIQLQVPEDQAERARQILATRKDEVIDRKRASGVPVTAAGRTGWVWPRCGAVVDRLIELCPSCGTIMPSGEATPGAPDAAAGERPDEDEAESPAAIGDRLAHRAFLAALFGLFTCPGLLHIYSAWVLWKLSGYEGGVTSTGRWKAYVAVAIDVPILLAIVLLVLSCIVGGFRS